MIEFKRNDEILQFPTDADLEHWLRRAVEVDHMTKSEAIVLYVLGAHHNGGRRFTDVQKFLCRMNGVNTERRESHHRGAFYSWQVDDGVGGKNKVSNNTYGNRSDTLYIYGGMAINGYLFSRNNKWNSELKTSEVVWNRYGKITKTTELKGPRASRGYGCTWLLGGYDRLGILHNCCEKRGGEKRSKEHKHTIGNHDRIYTNNYTVGHRWFVKPSCLYAITNGKYKGSKIVWNPCRTLENMSRNPALFA